MRVWVVEVRVFGESTDAPAVSAFATRDGATQFMRKLLSGCIDTLQDRTGSPDFSEYLQSLDVPQRRHILDAIDAFRLAWVREDFVAAALAWSLLYGLRIKLHDLEVQ